MSINEKRCKAPFTCTCTCTRARARFVHVCTYKGRKKRRMGKGGKGEETTSPNSLARTHARSIVPAGSHFVLARRPDILPWESIARDSLYPRVPSCDCVSPRFAKNALIKRMNEEMPCTVPHKTNFPMHRTV